MESRGISRFSQPRRNLARARSRRPGRWIEFDESARELDLAIVVDTSQGVERCLKGLHNTLREAIFSIRLAARRPRIAVVCYKDHGAEDQAYLTLQHAFNENLLSSVEFLKGKAIAPGLGGGGASALECALHEVNQLEWRPNARKAVVIISDKPPHGGGLDRFSACTHGNDYRDEVERLARRGAHLYPVLVGELLETRRVFEWMAAESAGAFLELEESADVARLLVAVAHRERGDLGRHSRELRRSGLSGSEERLLQRLSA